MFSCSWLSQAEAPLVVAIPVANNSASVPPPPGANHGAVAGNARAAVGPAAGPAVGVKLAGVGRLIVAAGWLSVAADVALFTDAG